MTQAARVAGSGGSDGADEAAWGPGVTLRPVRLATDEDLRGFVLQVIRLAENPKRRRDLLAGRLRFTLAPASHAPGPAAHASGPAGPAPVPAPAPASAPRAPAPDGLGSVLDGKPGAGRGSLLPARHGRTVPSGADHRIEKGAVTERAVLEAASAGARLVLGPRAVLTPLARDRARVLGVPIEKER